MEPATGRLLFIETSGAAGRVGLARGGELLADVALDQQRRHARDLAPTVHRLLTEQGWRPGDLQAVFVSQGPGSYTGLRVGLMSAKTLCWAVGCALVPVPTLEIVALQARGLATHVEVIEDAQQDRVYRQRFRFSSGDMPEPLSDLAVLEPDVWRASWSDGVMVTGPGLQRWHERLPSQVRLAPAERWLPGLAAMLTLGLRRWERQQVSDPLTLEPLYLRPSSAEEKWAALGK
jgi:tRNA threonylcarbamoyladenosine biosynthesis protein TsaB